MAPVEPWRRCSACKKPIAQGAVYQECSVSTCNRPRTGLVFCSLACWDSHLPTANHREAWAIERRAPLAGQEQDEPARRRMVRPDAAEAPVDDADVLVITSRLKDYIRRKSGMNTSDRVLAPLSDLVRIICDEAIDNARAEGRKTVMDRDLPRR